MATRAVGLPRLASASFTCAPIVLRAINIILAAVCIPVIYNLAAALDPRRSTAQLMLLVRVCRPAGRGCTVVCTCQQH